MRFGLGADFDRAPSAGGRRGELRYAFIAEQQGQWPVSILCEMLEVSRSGFYDYPSRQAHPTIDAEEIALLARVKAMAGTSRSS